MPFCLQEGTTMRELLAGIDIGSTTVKLVILDEQKEMVFGKYRRHMYNHISGKF